MLSLIQNVSRKIRQHWGSKAMKLMPTRLNAVKVLLALCGTAFISACTPEPAPITISTHIWPGYEPLSLAHEMGWLDKNLVKLIQSSSATDTIRLFEEGKIDAAGLTLDEVLRLRDKGIAVSVIFICDISAGADMLLARPGINNLSDLKGRSIAVEDGALGALMLYQVLQTSGLRLEDIKPVSITIDKQVDAWKRGTVDAAISFEPAASELIRIGGKKLFDSRQIPNFIFDVIAVRSAVLNEAHAEALRHLIAAHLKGLRYININPVDVAYRISPRFKLPHDQVMATFKGLVLPDLYNNMRLFDTSTSTILKSAAIIANVMRQAGILRQQADLNGLLRPEYLPRTN